MKFPTKHTVILYMVGIVVIVILAYITVGVYFRIPPPLPFGGDKVISNLLPGLFPELPSSTPVPTFTPPKSVIKVSVKDGRNYYAVQGAFTEKPEYRNNILMGKFQIYEDPNDSIVPVLIGTKGSSLDVGKYEGSLTSGSTWKLETVDALVPLIDAGTPAELRIFNTDKQVEGDPDPKLITVYENIRKGNWQIPNYFVLNPRMIGIVVK